MILLSVIGCVGQDPVKKVANAREYFSFSIASNRKNQNGEQEVTWVNCSIGTNNKVIDFIKKGTPLYVQGEANYRVSNATVFINLSVSKIYLLPSKREEPSGIESIPATPFIPLDVADDLPF